MGKYHGWPVGVLQYHMGITSKSMEYAQNLCENFTPLSAS